jgi:lysozyme family protein
MQHPFEALASEYANLLAVMQPTRLNEIEAAAGRLLGFVHEGKYKEVSDQLGIPQVFIATSFERESSSDFRTSPAQGDRWDRVSVHVPRGRGPFASWKDAALDAYRLDHLDRVGKDNWTWPMFCYEGELFNGFGYRSHGIHTPYDWAGSNNYMRGKYVADGVWDGGAVDSQLGIVPVARRMTLLEPSLDLPGWPIQAGTPPPISQPSPIGVGGGLGHSTTTLQGDLNLLSQRGFIHLDDLLVVDGSYGRLTFAAVRALEEKAGLTLDRGYAGPEVWAAIDKAFGLTPSPA